MSNAEIDAVRELLAARAESRGESLEEMRSGIDALAEVFPTPKDVSLEPVHAGGVPGEWIRAPGAAPERALLYLHGGGYVIGSVTSHRNLMADLSRASGRSALGIDYRLAPEHPFPAAVEDAVAAYRWLLEQGFQPTDIAVAGDSAGGGLALATLVALRDEGISLPGGAACISPWVDLEGIGDSMQANAAIDPMVNREGLLMMADHYLAGSDPHNPLAAPLHADLQGLPPLLIQVGTAETLLDDARRVAERARRDGVSVMLEEWPDMIHVWHIFAPILTDGRRAIERIGAFLRDGR
ncbi:MAG TPA: alpha/beta hydrolase [Gammaproteobacteria bacterium]|nr:alpha/beta hydrolase [Gammaproteobacteria bacterium]